MAGLRDTLRSIRFAGLGNSFRAIRYARLRDSLNAKHARSESDQAPRLPGKLRAAQAFSSGALFTFDAVQLSARFLTDDFVFLAWDGAGMSPSWAVAREEWPGCDIALEKHGDGWSLRGGGLGLQVSASGALKVMDKDGRLLREEGPMERRGSGWSQRAQLSPEACVYGLGGRFSPLNRRRAMERDGGPESFRFWNTDPGGTFGPGDDPLYICMPVYLCLHDAGCYLAFHDNTFDGSLSLGSELEVRFVDGPCRTYIAAGTPAAALERFTSLTGRPPLPPLWAFGFHQSRWGYRTEAELRRVFAGFKANDLPLSGLHLDIDHLDGFRTLTIDRKTHPDLPGFSRELAAAGAHLVVITDPGIKRDPGFSLYDEGLSRKVFCALPDGKILSAVVWAGWSVFPDFTNPKARAWWGTQYKAQISKGIDGFWHDMNEPAAWASAGESTLPLGVRHDMEGRGGDHREAHNIYGLMMNRAGYEGLRGLRPDRRPFIVTRAGWAGMQRWSWTWMGDMETSWAALRRTVAGVLGLGLSGMPYTGPDIGGFNGIPSAELSTRWFQLASFLPFFRTHSAIGLPPREPWIFGPETLAILRKSLKRRYRMLPYWYSLAYQATRDGLPLVRPLFWNEPQRSELREVDDEFLLGDGLLVAPILDEGAGRRAVVLPPGLWYELEGQRRFEGPGSVEIDAPIGEIPVLARAGAIIPMRDEAGGLVLHAFAGQGSTAEGRLFSDAGDGYGPYRLDSFSLTPAGAGELSLAWSSEGSFPWPHPSIKVRLRGFAEARVTGGGPAGSSLSVS